MGVQRTMRQDGARNVNLRAVVASSILTASGLASANAIAQTNNLVDLGPGTTGHAINNSGQVALDQGIYSGGTTTPLPALPGQTTPASPVAINAAGQVAGSAVTQVIIGGFGSTGTQSGSVPIAYINATLTNIAALFPEYTGSTWMEPGLATGINAGGQVVGYYTSLNPRSIDPPATIAFLYANGTSSPLPFNPPGAGALYPPSNMALGINDSGQIIGTFATPDPNSPANNKFDAYIYDSGTGTWTDLGQGTGYAINASGQVTGALDVVTVAGDTDTITGTYAFLYSHGTTTNLGRLTGGKNSAGLAINATGHVVGSSDLMGSSTTHAFLYNGGMNDLNTLISATDPLKPYITLTSAVGVNDSLLIVANGVDSRTSQAHAYLFQAPLLQIAPGPLSFGTQAVGGTSQFQTVTMTNIGATAITLGTISASTNFSLSGAGCGTSIAPSSQCAVNVSFAPTVAGALTGALTIPAGGAGYQVPLSGVAPITATLSASKSTATVGMSLTITWTSSPGSTCTAADSSSNPAFNGSIPPNGSKMLTETSMGTVNYGTHCTAPGVPEVDPVTTVVWNWPAVTATLGASPTTITAGQSTTLTWNSSNATSCTATGGGSDDNWSGAKATSGSQTVTEAVALAASSVVLTFGITCNSTASGLSGAASAKVTENSSSSSKSGGGSIDLVSIIALLGIVGLSRRARNYN